MKYLLPLLLLSTPATAQTMASITAGTDYISRGTSQTYDKPGVVLYAEHQTGGFYLGGILANVDFDDGTKLEADVVAGYRTQVDKYAIDVGVIAITYHGTQTTDWDMQEAHISISRPIGKTNVTAYVGWSPNYFNYGGHSLWTELSANQPLSSKVTISGAVARQSIANDKNYVTWNAGVTYNFSSSLSATAKYYDTDWKPIGSNYIDKIYAPRVVLSLTKVF